MINQPFLDTPPRPVGHQVTRPRQSRSSPHWSSPQRRGRRSCRGRRGACSGARRRRSSASMAPRCQMEGRWDGGLGNGGWGMGVDSQHFTKFMGLMGWGDSPHFLAQQKKENWSFGIHGMGHGFSTFHQNRGIHGGWILYMSPKEWDSPHFAKTKATKRMVFWGL